jgi:hypothetical protein
MTLLRVNFRGNVFVPLDHWVVEPGKGASETQRQRLITNSIFPTNLQALLPGYISINFAKFLRGTNAPTQEDKFGGGAASMPIANTATPQAQANNTIYK